MIRAFLLPWNWQLVPKSWNQEALSTLCFREEHSQMWGGGAAQGQRVCLPVQ